MNLLTKTRKITAIFMIFTIVFFLFSSTIMLIRPTATDDLSFLKFSSFALFNENILDNSWKELESQRNEIPENLFVKYGARLNAVYYYPLLSLAIRIFEKIPPLSPYQSVVFSLMLFQLISLAMLLFILGKNKLLFYTVFISLILSLIPWKWILPGNLSPFGFQNFFWYNGTAKNSILLIFLSFLVVYFSRFKLPSNFFWFFGFSSWLLMFLQNFPFVLMLFILWIFSHIFSRYLTNNIYNTAKPIICLLFSVMLFFLIKLIIYLPLFNFNFSEIFKKARPTGFAWLFFSILLIVIWMKMLRSDDKNNELVKWGNFLLPIFIFFSSLSIGFYFLRDYIEFQYASGIWLTGFFEFSRRTLGISHLIFWIFGGNIVFMLYSKKSFFWKTLIVLTISVSLFQLHIFYNYFNNGKEEIFKVKINSEEENVYNDENALYQFKIESIKKGYEGSI